MQVQKKLKIYKGKKHDKSDDISNVQSLNLMQRPLNAVYVKKITKLRKSLISKR